MRVSFPVYIFCLNSYLSPGHQPNTSAPGLLPSHHHNSLCFSLKAEEWTLDSDSTSIYTKSFALQVYTQNTIQAIPSTLVQHPQQADWASQIKPSRSLEADHLRHITPTSATILTITVKPTFNSGQYNLALLGPCKQRPIEYLHERFTDN